MNRLQHDVAWATAKVVMKLLVLRDEEMREVFINVYERIKAGLENYELQANRFLCASYGCGVP